MKEYDDWNWNCKISGQNPDILTCEVERTETSAEEIGFKPTFPRGYLDANVEWKTSSGAAEVRPIYSAKIENCVSEKVTVKWKTWKDYFKNFNCPHIGENVGYPHGAENDYSCCESGVLGVECPKEGYWCAGPQKFIEEKYYKNCTVYRDNTLLRDVAIEFQSFYETHFKTGDPKNRHVAY